MTVQILIGDALARLREMPAGSAHCVVTSPPYFGLRDYGMDGQMGLESTPAEFVAGMVELFREVRRVLRDDGTLWLNLGDSYCTVPHGPKMRNFADPKLPQRESSGQANRQSLPGLKHKDLIGIPWRVAFALQDDGWFLRQDIIWAKPNPMPESVKDRCTKSHEYLFLLSKSPRYYYDSDAIAEGVADATVERLSQDVDGQAGSDRVPGKRNGPMKAVGRSRGLPPRHTKYLETSDQSGLDDVGRGGKRNKRSVWTVATQPYTGAHFATFPPALIQPCILAGCPAGGTVLDPFGGAGTTGLVAERHGRNAILIELNPEYADMARDRLRSELCQVESEAPEPTYQHGPLFGDAA